MSRTTRALLCALCLSAFAFAAAPAFAQPAPAAVPSALFATVFRGLTVTVVGAGETETQAVNNALTTLRTNYIVLSYRVVSSFCSEVELPSTDPFGNHDTVTLCAAEIEARVIRKFTPITPLWP